MQACSKVLMVEPSHFGFNQLAAADNHFSIELNELTKEKLEAQVMCEWVQLANTLLDRGVEVIKHSNSYITCPDKVFPNNWFSTHVEAGRPSKLIFYPMRPANRRAERTHELVSILSNLYEETWDMTEIANRGSETSMEFFLEGTGSLVLDRLNRHAYLAISQRSDEILAQYWAKKMDYKLFSFCTSPIKPIYHTNVMLCIGSGYALVCLEVIEDRKQRDSLAKSLSQSHQMILLTKSQIGKFCGNCLELRNQAGDKLLAMSSGAYHALEPKQKNEILTYVKDIIHSPVETIETVGGGGVRCMLAELF